MTESGPTFAIAAYIVGLVLILGYAGVLVYRCYRA